MRDDLLDAVLDQATTSGFQRDKFQDYHQRLTWSQGELKDLISRRVSALYRRKYTKDDVTLDDVFGESKTGSDYFSYICDRTMMRPRDVLAYFNMVFDRCGGRTKIALKDIRSVEFDYSQSRRRAIVDEWRDHIPCVDEVIKFLGHRKLSATFRLEGVSDEAIDDSATQLLSEKPACDSPVVIAARAHYEDQSDASRRFFLYKMTCVLYRTGALGVRTQQNSRPQFSFISKPTISVDELSENTWCLVRPMLWQNLGRRGDVKDLFVDS